MRTVRVVLGAMIAPVSADAATSTVTSGDQSHVPNGVGTGRSTNHVVQCPALVTVIADRQDLWQQTNESDNSASAQIRIAGDSVTLLSTNDGL